jgi:chromate transporter
LAQTRRQLEASPSGKEPGVASEIEVEQPCEERVPLTRIAWEWTRIGCTGFGGPPAHITLLRKLVVERQGWMDARSFEDAIAACNLLPGPASTQLAIFSAYRVGGWPGAIIGGLGFVVPAVVMVLALSVVFLASAPPLWIRGAGTGAGAAVAAVALKAGIDLVGPSFERVREESRGELRWFAYLAAGAGAAALVGAYLVLVLLACGAIELMLRHRQTAALGFHGAPLALLVAAVGGSGIGALAWTAFKVGALSFGGGFVIVPLMQESAVETYHWMSGAEFLNAVALGQITPGPVTGTIAAVGYAAHGVGGALLAATVAFVPSFSFVLLGGGRFERLRANPDARGFLDGAGPAAIGAILGATVPLAAALSEGWQAAVLAAAAISLLALRRGVVATLLGAGVIGVVLALVGAPQT